MRIRPANFSDLEQLLALERSCPTAAHWSEQRYKDAIGPTGKDSERIVLVADSADPTLIAGFLVARRLSTEWELENIVVASKSRRSGVGRAMIESLQDLVREAPGASLHLEVRASNIPACKLYENKGLKQTGRRAAYYSEPAEDAILYTWTPS